MASRTADQIPPVSSSPLPPLPPYPYFLPPPPPASFVPPPPPPVFANGTFKTDSAAYVGAHKESLENEQEELREARDEYTGCRFRLQPKRMNLRKLREETGSKYGSAVDKFRHYLHTLPIELPPGIQVAFDQASISRDTLALFEAEYDEAEELYNRLEWTYTQKETKFVDRLPGSISMPNTAPQHDALNSEMECLTRFAVGSLEDTNFSDMIRDADLRTPSVSGFLPANQSGFTSEHMSLRQGIPNINDSSKQSDEIDLTPSEVNWIEKRERIDAWLLHMLSCSPLQKVHLKAIGEPTDLSDQAWWDTLKENWGVGLLDGPAFHTGDSTITHSLTDYRNMTVSETMNVENLQSAFHRSTAGSPGAAHGKTTESCVQPEVKPSSGFRCVVSLAQNNDDADEATHSISTVPTSTHRSLSIRDCHSMTTIHSSSSQCGPQQDHEVQSLASVCKTDINNTSGQRCTTGGIKESVQTIPEQKATDDDDLVLLPLGTNMNDSLLEVETPPPNTSEQTMFLERVEKSGYGREETATTSIDHVDHDVSSLDLYHGSLSSRPHPCGLQQSYTWPLSPLTLRRCPIPPLTRAGIYTRWGQTSCPFLHFLAIQHNKFSRSSQDFLFSASGKLPIRMSSPFSDDLCD
ncbi:hypothetical protein P153DRAFT_8998 [Dothidotthia symphoricarpi CBS 119687]|uniref:Uncharacterized protein n=1 Tax=Dothidotthia symphoricarpi CBS 119687 TaxID=1392245 RepID=A0A6A6AUW6_9PLEO|nr:uncharacterized protein P153DRAFT_8998 [Dothidotthia symphoricarpi CBS 119687]KAF2134755.1 hypothetical protein P153DRAFT_8998 [Dothidotthia symphoricarpi CBS 119687]